MTRPRLAPRLALLAASTLVLTTVVATSFAQQGQGAAAGQPAQGQGQRAPRPRASPAAITGSVVAGTRVTIYYGQPAMKGRKIWGDLVKHGEVWRLGANEATLLTNDKPITIGTVEVPAGAHTLYMLPKEDGTATLIINNQVGQGGHQYDAAQDLGRVELTKAKTLETQVESLTLTVGPGEAGGGQIRIGWADREYTVPFTVTK